MLKEPCFSGNGVDARLQRSRQVVGLFGATYQCTERPHHGKDANQIALVEDVDRQSGPRGRPRWLLERPRTPKRDQASAPRSWEHLPRQRQRRAAFRVAPAADERHSRRHLRCDPVRREDKVSPRSLPSGRRDGGQESFAWFLDRMEGASRRSSASVRAYTSGI